MFVENFEENNVQNLFLENYQHVISMAVQPIRGRGKNYLNVKYAQPSCENEESFHLYISDFEVRRSKQDQPFELADLDKIATADLREYLTGLMGNKYETFLNDFLYPTESNIIK